jgi:tight adherence protein B
VSELVISYIPYVVFGACVLFVVAIYLMWSDSRESGTEKVKRRIRRLSAASDEEKQAAQYISMAKEEVDSPLDRALLEVPRLHNLDRFLEQAGVSYGPAVSIAMSIVVGLTCSIVGILIFRSISPIPIALGFAAGLVIYWGYLSRKRENRTQLLIKQLPDALDYFARSLRAGNPFASAIKSAADEMQDPLAGELEITFDELNYGLEFDEALHNLGARISAEEIRLFVTAVLVQKSTGGNLAELLNRLAKLLRERAVTRGEIRIQASEMKSSARILVVLPFIVAGVLQLSNPDYLPVLLDSPGGQTLILIQLGLMAIGYFVMNRMVSFRI